MFHCHDSLWVPLLIRALSSPRLATLSVIAALALLAWVLAHWTWVMLMPRQPMQAAVAAPALPAKVLAERTAALHLFGSPGNVTAAAGAAPATAPSSIGVLGVYATRDGRNGFAVLVLDGKPIPAVTGKEFAPGMLLQRVHADHVEILRGAQVEIARMASAPVSAAQAATPAKTDATALQIDVRQLGPGQYGFSRAELLATLKRPEQMRLLGVYGPHPRGGALLEQSPPGGLPEKLGLKVGDVVTGINGKTFSGPGDVARLYEQMVKSESVSMDVLRAGEKMNFSIQVAP
jgi:type II secretory pathway component PulC